MIYMACWVDLMSVDPMIERTGRDLLESLGPVLQMAGVMEDEEGKFANIRGCVLLDMTKPLPTVLHLNLNQVVKKVKIKYDHLPDACVECHERGHIAKFCPKLKNTKGKEKAVEPKDAEEDDFTEVKSKHGQRSRVPAAAGGPSTSTNFFDALKDADENQQNGSDQKLNGDPLSTINPIGDFQMAVDPNSNDLETIQVENEEGEILADGSGQALDLNHSHAVTNHSDQPGNQDNTQKERRKAKKKAAKEKKQLERERERAGTSKGIARNVQEPEDEESSEDDEDRSMDRFWQTDGGKKQKGDKEVMDAIPEWETRREQGVGEGSAPENAGHSAQII
ncbi:hypothetical protein R1sor_004348 [Riccia sorocarpa]|uniref:CCHC-type domain-containing protein n=1 Tax=Riccia sorocarpa TaxID=122646 RepID=A0ABD3HJD0_9MARC